MRMSYQNSGIVLCSCFSLYLLTACNPPAQPTQVDNAIDNRVGAASRNQLALTDSTDFQAKITVPPQGITAPPQGITAPPQGITAPPQGFADWVDPSLSRLQVALANYHDIDASFYDTEQLSQNQAQQAGTFHTQLLGGVTHLVDDVVDTVDTALSEEEDQNTPSDAENTTPSSSSGVSGVVNTVLNSSSTVLSETLEPIARVTQNLSLLDQLTDLSLLQWLDQLISVPQTDLNRLKARQGQIRAGFVDTRSTTAAPLFGLYLQGPSGLKREVLSAGSSSQNTDSVSAFQLRETGPGFVREASRTQSYLSASTWRTVTRSLTQIDQGGTIEVFESRLTDLQGRGEGSGFILLTSASGQQERFSLSSITRSGTLLTQVNVLQGQVFSIDENSLGKAVAKLSASHQSPARQKDLDFNQMLLALASSH